MVLVYVILFGFASVVHVQTVRMHRKNYTLVYVPDDTHKLALQILKVCSLSLRKGGKLKGNKFNRRQFDCSL
jgi:hypothetical protein